MLVPVKRKRKVKLINNILHIEYPELIACGVSKGTIDAAKLRSTTGWEFTNDPDDRRRVLVRYDVLKEQYKKVVDQHYLPNAFSYYRSTIIELLLPDGAEALAFYREYRLGDGTGLPADRIYSYTLAARYCSMVIEVGNTGGKAKLARLGMSKQSFYEAVAAQIAVKEIPLPKAYTKLMAKVREFQKDGFASLVSKKYGNSNSGKLTDQQKSWIIARYAQVTKPDARTVHQELLQHGRKQDWPVVSESCVHKFLLRPDVAQLWHLGRHGKQVWKNRYEHHARLVLPAFRDALWCSDGSKLNFFYRDSAGKISSAQQIYMIADVYSEAILGWHISKSENYSAQYAAFKMAVNHAQAKPYQLLYDNQGGHKAGVSQEFFSRLCKHHFPAAPYNAQSKPIEMIIGRFQHKVMSQFWFFTGQNITARSLDSRAVTDYIKQRIDKLPTLDEVAALMKQLVEQWNAGINSRTGKARLASYHESINPTHTAIDYTDMVDLFWLKTDRPVTYTRGGLRLEVHGVRYEFEVMTDAGQPDVQFMRKHVQDKFVVAYDPDDLSHVRLYQEYSDGLRFIAAAYEKQSHPRALQDYSEDSAAGIRNMMRVRKEQLNGVQAALQQIKEESGVLNEEDAAYLLMHGDKSGIITAEDSILINRMGLYSDGNASENQILD